MAAIGPAIDQNGGDDDDDDDDENDDYDAARRRVHEHDGEQITVIDGVNITTGTRIRVDGHF